MRLPGFGVAILVISAFGVIINISSFAFLLWRHQKAKRGSSGNNHNSSNGSRQRARVQSTLFHHLLTVLSLCDLLVVICCSLAYGLPDVWQDYLDYQYPYLVPYLLPITHIAVMASVYCTILIR